MMNASPMLRWAGGKRQLQTALLSLLPKSFENGTGRYFEPFVGGGALFFALANQDNQTQTKTSACVKRGYHLSDSNAELINFYKVVRDAPNELIRRAKSMEADISEDAFYRVRSSRPKSDVGRAARLLYLNRLCFNGLYRVNSLGEFNVPFGRLKNPIVCNPSLILSCSNSLSRSILATADFPRVLKKAKPGDLVYFDPPYIPLTATSSFASYQSAGFGISDQKRLAQTITTLTAKGVFVILSNSDTPLSREIFKGLTLFSVPASRSISASPKSRKRVREIIAINFPMTAARNPAIIKKLVRN